MPKAVIAKICLCVTLFIGLALVLYHWFGFFVLLFWMILGVAILDVIWPSFSMFGFQIPHRSRTGRSQIALTFDDGPHPEFTPKILDILKANQARATFFVLGYRAEKYPEIVERMQTEGHEVGCHGYHHKRWILKSPRLIAQELYRWLAAVSIRRQSGDFIWLRTSHGQKNPWLP